MFSRIPDTGNNSSKHLFAISYSCWRIFFIAASTYIWDWKVIAYPKSQWQFSMKSKLNIRKCLNLQIIFKPSNFKPFQKRLEMTHAVSSEASNSWNINLKSINNLPSTENNTCLKITLEKHVIQGHEWWHWKEYWSNIVQWHWKNIVVTLYPSTVFQYIQLLELNYFQANQSLAYTDWVDIRYHNLNNATTFCQCCTNILCQMS